MAGLAPSAADTVSDLYYEISFAKTMHIQDGQI